MAYYLLQAVFIPLLLAPLAYYIARKYGVGPSTWFTFGVMLYSTIMLIIPYISGSYAEFYPWSQLGEFGLVLDGLSSPFALMIYILSTVLVLYSRPYMIHKITEEYHQLTETNDAPIIAVVVVIGNLPASPPSFDKLLLPTCSINIPAIMKSNALPVP